MALLKMREKSRQDVAIAVPQLKNYFSQEITRLYLALLEMRSPVYFIQRFLRFLG